MRSEADPAADEAIASVTESAEIYNAVAVESVEAAIVYVCHTMRTFTTEDVWKHVNTPPDEPRFMGGAMRAAKIAGLCRPSMQYQRGTRIESHGRPVRVWVSLTYKGQA